MKPHRTDLVSLTFALIFLGIGAWWLLARLFHLSLPKLGWVVAVTLIVFGLLGILGALRSNPNPSPAAPLGGSGMGMEPTTTASGPPADGTVDTESPHAMEMASDAPVTAPAGDSTAASNSTAPADSRTDPDISTDPGNRP